jgi:hypothetical protein
MNYSENAEDTHQVWMIIQVLKYDSLLFFTKLLFDQSTASLTFICFEL